MDEFDDLLLDDYSFDIEESTTTTQPPPAFNDTQATSTQEPTSTPVKKIRFDEQLLLDTKGIPLLRNESRYLKFRGKGHEDQDLKKLMTYYTVWANNLYPKLRFRDFARRVRKPASGQRIKVMVHEWQQEYKDKRQIRLDVQNELSGQTVGDEDGDRQQEEESSDDDNRPLFFPITESASAAMEKAKKVKKPKTKAPAASKKQYRSSATINSSDDATDDDEDNTQSATKQPDTITFSDDDDDDIPKFSSSRSSQKRRAVLDDDDEEDKAPVYSKSGREHALAILAEKRKQRELAQKKQKQQKEEEEQNVTQNVDTIVDKNNSVDDIMNEYYDDDIQLALSDNELLEIQKAAASAAATQNNDKDNAVETNNESKDILEKEPEFDSIVMEGLGIEAGILKEKSNVIIKDTEATEEDSEMYDI